MYTLEDCIRDIGEIPLCQCDECQKNSIKVNIKPEKYKRYIKHGYPRFIYGHSNRGKTNPFYNKKHKPESIELIKQNHADFSGENNPMFGTHPTLKTIEKMSESHKGKSPWNKGIEWEEMSGENHPLFGTHRSEETINKIKQNLPDLSGKNNPFYGQKHTEEDKFKMRIPHLSSRGKHHPRFGKSPSHGLKIFPHQTPLQGLIMMHRWDRLLAKYYDSQNILYLYEPDNFEMIIDGKEMSYTPDFLLPIQNKFIEVKGWMRPLAKLKCDKFREEWSHCFDYEVLMQSDLKSLGIDLRTTDEEREILENYKNRTTESN